MHVTPFSAATILVFAIASPLHAQGIEVFGGYSVNADYVQNRPAILVVDQKVSPFFSLGSGPTGFEASFKHDVRNGLGIKVDVSGYSDTFPPGPAAYCQPDSSTAGIACGTGLTFQADRSIHYADAHADAGLALAIGGGFDIRLTTRIGLRAAMDYDPTFLVRPVFPDLTPDAQGRVALRPASNERQRQDHVRLSIGTVWHIR
jgi:hypothetical protein